MPFKIITYNLLAFVLITITGSFYIDDGKLISPDAIGPVSLCQDISTLSIPYVKDTCYGSDGQSVHEKIYGTKDAYIIVNISRFDSTTIHGVRTRSKLFKTKNGIAVGSSLSDLFATCKDIKLTVSHSEIEDYSFHEDFQNSLIAYRPDLETSMRLMNQLDEGTYSWEEIIGLYHETFEDVYIAEIAVFQSESCE